MTGRPCSEGGTVDPPSIEKNSPWWETGRTLSFAAKTPAALSAMIASGDQVRHSAVTTSTDSRALA
jgi:hypothetical protein